MDMDTPDSPASTFSASYDYHPKISQSYNHASMVNEQILQMNSHQDFPGSTDSEHTLETGSPCGRNGSTDASRSSTDCMDSSDSATSLSGAPETNVMCPQVSGILHITSVNYDIIPPSSSSSVTRRHESDEASDSSDPDPDSCRVKFETHLDNRVEILVSCVNSDPEDIPAGSPESPEDGSTMISGSGFNSAHSPDHFTPPEIDPCLAITAANNCTRINSESSLTEPPKPSATERSDISSKSLGDSKEIGTVDYPNLKKKGRRSLLASTTRKRKRNYWTSNWFNSNHAKTARLNTSWTPCPEVPSTSEHSYCRNLDKVQLAADPRNVVRKSSFIHSLGLVTHAENKILVEKQNQPRKRKRRASVVKKYTNLCKRERANNAKHTADENIPSVEIEVEKCLATFDCNICNTTGCNIRCDFCASCFHIPCLRVKSSRAPDPVFLPFCPKCVGNKCPPKLQLFNAKESTSMPNNKTEIQIVNVSSIPKSSEGPSRTLHKPEPKIIQTKSNCKTQATVFKIPDCTPIPGLKLPNRQKLLAASRKYGKVNYSTTATLEQNVGAGEQAIEILNFEPPSLEPKPKLQSHPNFGDISGSYANGAYKNELTESPMLRLGHLTSSPPQSSTSLIARLEPNKMSGQNNAIVNPSPESSSLPLASRLISRPTQYKTLTKSVKDLRKQQHTASMITRSSALLRKLPKKIFPKTVELHRRSNLLQVKKRSLQMKTKQQGLNLNCAKKGNPKSNKEYRFVTKLERMVTSDNFNDNNIAGKDDLIRKYETMKNTSAKLKSVRDETNWQLSIQRSIFDEFNEKKNTNSASCLQNLKKTITGTVQLTKQMEEAISPLLNPPN